MISIDLKDAYLQVPMHPDSRKFLWFVADGQVYKFRALCFGLSTAPQVFTRVMASVSAMLHRLGIRMLQYLDDWLVLASSREEVIRARDNVLPLCSQLGIAVNLEKSCLIPAQTAMYLRMVLVSPSLRAFPTSKRIATLQTQIAKISFLQSVKRHLLASSLGSPIVPVSSCSGGLLADAISSTSLTKAVGLCGRVSQCGVEPPDSGRPHLVVRRSSSHCRSVSRVSPARPSLLVRRIRPRLGSQPVRSLCLRSLVSRGTTSLDQSSGVGSHSPGPPSFPLLSGGSTCSSLFGQHHSSLLYTQAGGHVLFSPQRGSTVLLRWAEKWSNTIVPQFTMGSHNVVAESLSRRHQIIGSELTLVQEVVDELLAKWPATIDLFTTSLNYRRPVYFAPLNDRSSAGTDSFLLSWDGFQAFPRLL